MVVYGIYLKTFTIWENKLKIKDIRFVALCHIFNVSSEVFTVRFVFCFYKLTFNCLTMAFSTFLFPKVSDKLQSYWTMPAQQKLFPLASLSIVLLVLSENFSINIQGL